MIRTDKYQETGKPKKIYVKFRRTSEITKLEWFAASTN